MIANPDAQRLKIVMFNQRNYKFSTQQPGRKSTLYFDDGVGNKGRIKRSDSSGGSAGIFYGSDTTWLFISPSEKEELEDNFDTAQEMFKFLIKVPGRLKCGESIDGYSLNSAPGWTVFEISSQRVHPSAGAIFTNDPDASAENIDKALFDLKFKVN